MAPGSGHRKFLFLYISDELERTWIVRRVRLRKTSERLLPEHEFIMPGTYLVPDLLQPFARMAELAIGIEVLA